MAIDATQANLDRRGAVGGEVQGDYEYGADYREGTQEAEVTWVQIKESQAGRENLVLTVGLPPVEGRTVGAKADMYVAPYGAQLRGVLLALAPELIGQAFDERVLIGRRCLVDIGTWSRDDGDRPQIEKEKTDDGWLFRIAPATGATPSPAPATTPAPAPAPAAGGFEW